MTPGEVPAGPLLVDTDLLSWIALSEGRADEVAALLVGHEPLLPVVTGNPRDFSLLAEVGGLLTTLVAVR